MVGFEFYFDISSPWTYLAFARVESIAEKCGVDIDWKPILVGGVFNSVNETVYEQRANPHLSKDAITSRICRTGRSFAVLKSVRRRCFPCARLI